MSNDLNDNNSAKPTEDFATAKDGKPSADEQAAKQPKRRFSLWPKCLRFPDIPS